MANKNHHDTPPAMDYAQHDATYRGFIAMVKGGIVSMAFVVLSLYAFIEGHNAVIGVVLLVLAIVVPVAMTMFGGRRRT
jgi:ABC-type transport system involved in cytochrome bd biosynthesis fused ATPase/permease subunit